MQRPILAALILALALGALCVGELTFGPRVAAAQPRTALAPFEGRRSAAVRRLVSRAIRRDADLVTQRRVDRAAGRAGVEGTSADGVSELAQAVDAQIVVQGSISGTRRRTQVELVFRDADGGELARGEAEYRAGRRAARDFNSAVSDVFERAATALASRAAPPPEPEERPPATRSEARARPEPPAGSREEAPQDGLGLVTVLAGLVVRTRQVEVVLADGNRRLYELASGAYPELTGQIEARPFANDAHLGRGLFLRGAFAHSVGLGSETADGSAQVDTNFLRFQLEAGWLAPLADVVELGVGVGASYEGYFLAPNVVLPSAEYIGIRPALRARFRLAQETLVLDTEVAYRGVFAGGEIRGAFGADGETHGVDVGVQLGGNLLLPTELGFTWAARFDWVGYYSSFSGAATDAPAETGYEGSVRFSLLVGWSFR